MRLITALSLGLFLSACDLKVDGLTVPSSDTTSGSDETGEISDDAGSSDADSDDGADSDAGWGSEDDAGWGWEETSCEDACTDFAAIMEDDCLSSGAPAELCSELSAYTYEDCLYTCDDGSSAPSEEECFALAEASLFACLTAGEDPEVCFYEAETLLEECLSSSEPDDRELECAESAAVIELECVSAGVDPELCFVLSSVFFEECLYADSGYGDYDYDYDYDYSEECADMAAETELMCLASGGTEAECAELGTFVLEACLSEYMPY